MALLDRIRATPSTTVEGATGYERNERNEESLREGDNREVCWRVAAMRARLTARVPLAFLVARETPRGADGCLSCGDPVQHFPDGVTARCRPCALASRRVIEEHERGQHAARGPPACCGLPRSFPLAFHRFPREEKRPDVAPAPTNPLPGRADSWGAK